jgi:hypothetical protein
MSVLKYYNPTTEAWEPILAGKQGPQGPSGVVATTAPITNSGTSTAANIGLDYISLQYGQNAIMNGAFEINQRNFTSLTNAVSLYTFDRWQVFSAGTGTSIYTNQSFLPGELESEGAGSGSFIRIATSGQSGTDVSTQMHQHIENVRTFAGQTVTYSFWAKANSGTPKLAVEFRQYFGTGGSSINNHYAGQVTISTSWARYSVTTTIPSISDKVVVESGQNSLRAGIWFSGGSNSDSRHGSLGIQNNTFEIWGVQLEAGSVATPFKRHAPNIQAELAACQRYYVRFSNTGAFAFYGIGRSFSTSNYDVFVNLPVPMRTIPTVLEFSNLTVRDTFNNVFSAGSPVISNGQSSNRMISVSSAPGGLTAGRTVFLLNNNDSTAFLGFSAEL